MGRDVRVWRIPELADVSRHRACPGTDPAPPVDGWKAVLLTFFAELAGNPGYRATTPAVLVVP